MLISEFWKKKSKSQTNSVVLQNADPSLWKQHRFGLSPARWEILKNKSFWITGAGTGYGRCIAIALAAAGATVYLTGRRNEKLLETIREAGYLNIPVEKCHALPGDINDCRQIEEACKIIASRSHSLYGLINNAAVPAKSGMKYPLIEYTLDDWNTILNTNLKAHWWITKSILPHMCKNKSARILCITSEAGWAFTPGFGPYNISKAALNNLTASMAEEYSLFYSQNDLQINAVVPGEARTEMNQSSDESPYSVVSMALLLLSHPEKGPNGKFFHRDGRHLKFAYSDPYEKSIR